MNKTGPIGSFENALKTKNKNFGGIIGVIPMLGSLGIAIGYSVVVGWILKYTVGSIDGSLFRETNIAAYFGELVGDFGSVPWHIMGIVICVLILIGGVSKGIELANMVLIPLFYILFMILLVRVLTLPNIKDGIDYLLVPDWEVLSDPKAWAMALGQALFSLSLAGSGMVVYGSYLKDDINIPKAAIQTAIFSSLGALLCAFVVIPAVFAFGISAKAGPPLVFISIPLVFQKMPFGYFFSILFNISILFAAVSSLINLMECPIEALENRLKLSRKAAVISIGIIMIAVGIFIEKAEKVGSWMDFVSVYIVPTGAMLSGIMTFWIFGMKTFRENVEKGMDKPCLGSVVTNNGYSDWATQDISASIKEMYYRLSRRESDFLIEYSEDGINFKQMRIFHLFKADDEIPFGIYACSPENSSFKAVFSNMEITECKWLEHK